MANQFEIRNLGSVNSAEESRHIEGCAIVFNKYSAETGLNFREIIEPTAITQELIDNSDVYLTFNHDDNKVLGRWNKGQGSLQLQLKPEGVYFYIEAPKTDLGDEVLEYLRRGDINKCSFAFWIDPKDPTAETWTQQDGIITRIIHKISLLHDVSIVWTPAYSDTQVTARSMEKIKELQNMIDNKEELKENKPADLSEEKEEKSIDKDETVDKDEDKAVDAEDKAVDAEDKLEPNPSPVEEIEDKQDEPENKKEQRKTQLKKHNIMEKRFSILNAIRSVAENRPMDAATQAVVNAGKNEMRSAGVSMSGQIQIPVENRAAVTVEAEGEDVVVTDFTNILDPLRTNNVLAASGANILTGLVGDLQIPSMSASNVNWEGETTAAKDGAGVFSNVKLTPHRLSAYIDVSKQFLVQDSLGAEALIRRDLVNAIQSKLEDTIFSDTAATGNVPGGIFAGKTPTAVKTFAGLCDLEADVEDANFYGEAKYIVSPKAKAALRAMAKSTKSTQLVLEGDNIDGTPVLSTGHIASKTFAYGDWSSLYVGQWGALDLTVDPYTKASEGQVRIVINAFFDFKVAREGGIAYGTVGE